jgi:hypothetical protein
MRSQSEAYRNRARERFPNDRARRLFLRGLALERDGGVKGRAIVNPDRPVESDEMQLRWWSGAATHYVDALEADPDYLPAALHLGRIRMLQGNRPESRRLFRKGQVRARRGYLR